jgi:hypothetical protein
MNYTGNKATWHPLSAKVGNHFADKPYERSSRFRFTRQKLRENWLRKPHMELDRSECGLQIQGDKAVCLFEYTAVKTGIKNPKGTMSTKCSC